MRTMMNTRPCLPMIVVLASLAVVPAATAAPFTNTVRTAASGLSPETLWLQTDSLALADFDGDGTCDAAVAGTYVGGVDVLFSKTGSPQTWSKAGRWPLGLVAADLDGDSDIDLAVTLQDEGGVAILANDGTGSFTRIAFYATAQGPGAIAAADLNKDSYLDLVVANRFAGSLSVLLGSASGFAVQPAIALPALTTPPVPSEPTGVAVMDLNADTWPDVAVCCAADDSVKILMSIGGTLTPAAVYPAGPYPVAIAAGDVNGDELADLVVADREAPQVTVLTQDVAGLFSGQDLFLLAVPYGAFEPAADVLLADLDGDSDLDIRTTGAVLDNDGTGSFTLNGVPAAPNAVYALGQAAGGAGRYLGVISRGELSVTYHPAATASSPARSADLDGDGTVNVFDLFILAEAWNTQAGEANFNPAADLDGDGAVSIFDLFVLAEAWNTAG